MAYLSKGPLGNVRGKFGNIVATKRKGKTLIKTLPEITKAPSARQRKQNDKFKMAVDFYRPLRPVVKLTFRDANAPGLANAYGHFLTNAVGGDASNIVIDYTKVMVSRGYLPVAGNPTVQLDAGALKCTWLDNSGLGIAEDSDQVVIVAYCPARQLAVYAMDVADRSVGATSVDVSVFKGEELHVYMAFLSIDGKIASDSVYMGKFNEPA